MARHDDEHTDDDETTVIGDGRQSAETADAAERQPTAGSDDGVAGPEADPGAQFGPQTGPGIGPQTGPGFGPQTGPGFGPQTGPGIGPQTGPGIGPGPQRPAIEPPRPAPGGERRAVAQPPGPALVAVGLGLLTKNGWIFQDINLTLRPSSVAAIVGPAGTGRTSLLLALAGRMEANTGSLTIAGHSLRDRPKNVRAVSAVARAGRSVGPEPRLTISESVTERCLIEDEPVLSGRSRFEEACKALNLVVDPKMQVGRLAGEQATLLALALACVRVSAVIILDDLDRDVSAATQQRMLDALIRLAKAMGPTIIVTTTDRIPVMDADVVLDLTPMDGAAIWELDIRDAPTEVLSRELGGYSQTPWAAELGTVDAGPDDEPDSDSGNHADDLADNPDHDGRWSRERWESPPSDGYGTEPGPADPGPDDPGPNAGAAPGADDAPAPTEDPR